MKLLSFCWHPTKAIKSHLSFPYPSFTAINHEHGSLGFPPLILGKKKPITDRTVHGRWNWIHRLAPWSLYQQVQGRSEASFFILRRSFLGWAKDRGGRGNFRGFFCRLERFSITELVRFLYEFAMSFLWSLCVFFEGWFCPNLLHLSVFWLHVCSVTVPETNILATTKSDGCVAMLVSGSENGRSYA